MRFLILQTVYVDLDGPILYRGECEPASGLPHKSLPQDLPWIVNRQGAAHMVPELEHKCTWQTNTSWLLYKRSRDQSGQLSSSTISLHIILNNLLTFWIFSLIPAD